MLTLYLTRHGQTQWNLEERMQGWADSSLTEEGIYKARLLGERLKNVPFDAIFCSTSERTIKTAEIIRGTRSLDIIKEEDLRELNLSCWQGLTIEDIKSRYSEDFNIYKNTPHIFKPHSGETFMDLQKRAVAVINKIISEETYKNVLIVTHGLTIRTIMAHLENRPIERIWETPPVRGASLTVIQIESRKPRVIMYGDTSHFDEDCDWGT